jgi:hypothetical protein
MDTIIFNVRYGSNKVSKKKKKILIFHNVKLLLVIV